MIPKLVMFDLDGTLAVSKSPIDASMADLLAQLMARTKVAVISGGALPQYLSQVVGRLPSDAPFSNFYILPTSGAALYEYAPGKTPVDPASWHEVYAENISAEAAFGIEAAIRAGVEASKLVDLSSQSWGPRIEYRGSQVSFSALGQQAPAEEKAKWDPDKAKRRRIREEIQKHLPEGYTANMGGMTTIDITKNGVDKAYGIHRICERLGIPESDSVYVGDQLVPGGNDEAALKTGAVVHSVDAPADTAEYIRLLLSAA